MKQPLRYKLLWLFSFVVLIYIMSPIIFVIINSFSSVAFNVFPPPGFSLQWYHRVMGQPQFLDAFLRSVYVAAITALVSIVLGTSASLALVRYKFFGRDLLKAFFMSPLVMPRIVIGIALFIFFVRIGFFGNVPSLILAHTVISMPFVITIVTANLMGLDQSLEEASMDLGARRFTTFSRIVLPQILPGLSIAGLFAFITSFDQVETSLFLVRPVNNTLPIEMFLYMERWQDPTIAALSTLLIALSVVLVLGIKVLFSKVDVFKMLD